MPEPSRLRLRARATAATVGWWCPADRGVLRLDGLRVSRSLRRSVRDFEIRVDTAFDEVVAACGDPPAAGGVDRRGDPDGVRRAAPARLGPLGRGVAGRPARRRPVRRRHRRAVRRGVDVPPRPGLLEGRPGGAWSTGSPTPRRPPADRRPVVDAAPGEPGRRGDRAPGLPGRGCPVCSAFRYPTCLRNSPVGEKAFRQPAGINSLPVVGRLGPAAPLTRCTRRRRHLRKELRMTRIKRPAALAARPCSSPSPSVPAAVPPTDASEDDFCEVVNDPKYFEGLDEDADEQDYVDAIQDHADDIRGRRHAGEHLGRRPRGLRDLARRRRRPGRRRHRLRRR